MQFENKKALVVGMARSGIASAMLLLKHRAIVTINDSKTIDKLDKNVQRLINCGAIDALGINPEELLEQDLIVLSPGVPLTSPFAVIAKQNGIEVIGEIELAYRCCQAPIICITGTNGKTTTTSLVGEIFKASGKNTFVLGNIGVPIAEKADTVGANDIVVAEVAGFQLESISQFHTPACTVLNISEDHLDRFHTMQNYIASKEMIFKNQKASDIAVLNADDHVVLAMAKKTLAKVLLFSSTIEVENGAFVKDGQIVFKLGSKEQVVCATQELKIPGRHNLENALAAVALTMGYGVKANAVQKALQTFEGVEHRIEFVKEVNGVRYINDSKGTNPDSTIKAVQAAIRPTVLLLGGSNKNSDYTPVFRAFGDRIKAVVALGETSEQILRDAKICNFENIHVCKEGFLQAVTMAKSLAVHGDDVLLSPACASYDMFLNFEQRGNEFKRIVNEM